MRYAAVDGLAIFEGDIVLGTLEEVEQQTQELRDVLSGELSESVVITGAQFRWPGCTIPHDRFRSPEPAAGHGRDCALGVALVFALCFAWAERSDVP